jgi:hypothetical protein
MFSGSPFAAMAKSPRFRGCANNARHSIQHGGDGAANGSSR